MRAGTVIFNDDERFQGDNGHITPAKLRPGMRSDNSGIAHKLLNAEGTAATASALHVRVVKLESGAFDRFDVVDLDAFQVHFAHLVNEDFQALKFVHVVAV